MAVFVEDRAWRWVRTPAPGEAVPGQVRPFYIFSDSSGNGSYYRPNDGGAGSFQVVLAAKYFLSRGIPIQMPGYQCKYENGLITADDRVLMDEFAEVPGRTALAYLDMGICSTIEGLPYGLECEARTDEYSVLKLYRVGASVTDRPLLVTRPFIQFKKHHAQGLFDRAAIEEAMKATGGRLCASVRNIPTLPTDCHIENRAVIGKGSIRPLSIRAGSDLEALGMLADLRIDGYCR